MLVYLIEARPAVKTTGAIQVHRFSSSSLWTRADGVDWAPRLSVPFRRAFQAFDGAFSEAPATFGSFEVRMSTGDPVAAVIGMAWDGRLVNIWRGSPGQDTAQMELVFSGDADTIEATKQGFSVTLRGPGYALTRNMLSIYAGSGMAEGMGSLANTPKPMVLGRPLNVAPIYLDRARGIFQWHAYGYSSLEWNGVYDAGSQLSWSGRDHPNYDALNADDPGPGYFSTCYALGMGRHGGLPIDILTCDPIAGDTGNGLMSHIMMWLGDRAGVALDLGVIDWFYNNFTHPQDNYITEQTSYEAVLRDMLLKIGGYLYWTPDGRMSAGLVRRGAAPSFSLGRHNIAPTPNVRATQPPFFRRRMSYRRAWRTLSYGEVRTPREINPRGNYLYTNTYRYYDLVTLDANTWLHIGEADTSGVDPTEGTVWTLFGQGVTKTSQLDDDAGFALTATWPNVSGLGRPVDYADVTAANTAAAITGQGWGATASEGAAANAQVRLGQNQTVNSRFVRGMHGWYVPPSDQYSIPVESGVNVHPSYHGLRDVLMIHPQYSEAWSNYVDAAPRGAWSGEHAALTRKLYTPVRQGDRLFVAALVGVHRCVGQVYCLVFDNAGELLQAEYVNGGRDQGGWNGDPSAFDRVGRFSDVTAPTAAFACVMIRLLGNGGGEPYLFFTEAMIARVAAGQTAWPDYTDGPVDVLADQTSANTAAGFTGQGSLATLSSLGYGGPFLTGFGSLSGLSNLFFGSNSLLEGVNGIVASVEAFKTSLGISSGFTGQGVLASLGAISSDVHLSGVLGNRLSGFGGDPNFLNAGRVAWALGDTVESFKPQEGGANITENRSAAAFTGQSAWATYTGLATYAVEGRVGRLGDDGYMESSNVYKANVGWLNTFFPGEGGANVTENRTAAAIVGQGGLATAGQIGSQNVASYFNFSAFQLNYSITRSDGVNTVTEELAITSLGIAAAISGQGAGATANNLYELDPNAAQAITAAGGGRSTVGIGTVISRALPPGGAAACECQAGSSIPGTGSGSASVLIEAAPAGSSSWVTIASSDSSSYSSSEPWLEFASGSLVNNTSVRTVYSIRARVVTGGSGGPRVDADRSYLTA